MAHFKTVKAHIDYHVEVEQHRYSVPHALVNNRDQSAPATASDWVSPNHAHVRGPGYYQ